MATDFYVVIATAGRPALLDRTLESLARCRKPESYRATVVVENGPVQQAQGIVERWGEALHARYLYEPVGNKSQALNRVLEEIRDGLIFFTDDDTRMHPDTLVAYADVAGSHRAGYFYGGPTGVDYQRPPPAWLIHYLPPSASGFRLNGTRHEIRQPAFLGFNWAAHACDLIRCGGFDSRFGPGAVTGSVGQESEMQRVLLAQGVEAVYVPDAMVWHYVPANRCSVQWTTHRAYRQGIQGGLHGEMVGKRVWIFPGWVVRRWVESVLALPRAVLTGTQPERFAAIYDFRKRCGFLRGHWLAYRGESGAGTEG